MPPPTTTLTATQPPPGGNGPTGLELRTTLQDSEKIRKAWKERGGTLGSGDFNGMAIIMAGDSMSGYGAGISVSGGLLYMKPPVLGESPMWWGFRLGAGMSAAYISISSTSISNINIPLYAGVMVGLGTFAGDGKWRGVVVGIDYQPALTIQFPDKGESTTDFNDQGFNITVDFTSLDNLLDTVAREAHFRIYGFILPTDDFFFATIGVGAVWY